MPTGNLDVGGGQSVRRVESPETPRDNTRYVPVHPTSQRLIAEYPEVQKGIGVNGTCLDSLRAA